MAAEDILLRLRLQGQRQVQSGLGDTARSVDKVGKATSGAGRELGRFRRQSDGSTRTFTTLRAGSRGVSGSMGLMALGIGRAAAAVGGLYAVGAGFKFAVGEATEAAKVSAQTAAVLRSTGGAAGVTARQVEKLAGSISTYAGIDDEAIQSGENLLLTFTNVRNAVGKGNHIFDQATVAATNMSVALGQDMKSSVIQLGKALNDPVKGITALQRVGVSFTSKQRDQIQALVKNGKTLDAQKIILRELNKEFGGSAAAQATPMAKLKVTLGNLAETVGKQLLPYLNKGAAALNTFLRQMQNGQGAGGKFVKIVKTVGSTIGTAFRTAVPVVAAVIAKVRELAERYGPGVIRFGQSLVNAFRQAVGPIRPVLTALQLVGTRIVQIAGFVARVLKPGLNGAAQVLKGTFQIVGGIIHTITALIHGDFSGALNGLKSTATGVKNVVVGAFSSVLAIASSVATTVGGLFGSILKAPINAVIGAINAIPDIHIPKLDLGPLGSIGGQTVGIPNITPLAKGTRHHRGGPAIVGEQGPEILIPPRGSQVIPNRQAFGGGADLTALVAAIERLASRPIVWQVSGRELARIHQNELARQGSLA